MMVGQNVGNLFRRGEMSEAKGTLMLLNDKVTEK
jgi:hypothetical protein